MGKIQSTDGVYTSGTAAITSLDAAECLSTYGVVTPTPKPTAPPTKQPTMPTANPSSNPTSNPTAIPTLDPITNNPTMIPTQIPTMIPTEIPTLDPVTPTTGAPTSLYPACQDPPSRNMYSCVRLSGFSADDFNGIWEPWSYTDCYDGVYIYQLSDGSQPNVYLCHGRDRYQWTISDTICNQTDDHRQAFCDRSFHNIAICGAGTWKIQNSTGLYSSDENAAVDFDCATIEPSTVPSISPTTLIVEETIPNIDQSQ